MGLLFAAIAHLFEVWPTDAETLAKIDNFTPIDETQLRKWLTVKAGHILPYAALPFNTKKEKEFSMRVLMAQMESDRMNKLYGWPQEVEGGCIAVLRPASIATLGENSISEKKFCEVTNKIFNFLYEKIGFDIQEWKESGEKRRPRR
jgi:hypothetical protein